MNYCLISTGYYPEDGGGIGTYIRSLAQGLIERGHSVCVLTQTRCEEKEEDIDGVHVVRRKFRYFPKLEKYFPGLWWSIYISREIERLDKCYNFDVIEFPNWEGTGFWYSGKNRRKRVVTRVHTPYFETLALDKKLEEINWGDRFLCFLEEKACRRSDLIISSTVRHRAMIVKKYAIKEDAVKILPLGIKLDLETSNRIDGLVEVLYVSRLENRKGSMVLLDAIPKILDKYPHVLFSIAGKDRDHAPGGLTHKEYFLKNYSHYHDRVNFFGFLSNQELRRRYMECDIFAVPSVYESFGLIYVEAMMHAKPVVGGRAGGIPEVVEDGVSGILVDPNNVEQFVDALSGLIEDKEKRLRMGQEGQRICREKFDYKIMTQRAEAIYFGKD